MSTQPEALRLADALEMSSNHGIRREAAAELRRLHAELERCKQVCAATSEAWREEAALSEPVQEPVADRAAFERHAERLGYSVDPDTREGREGGYWSSHTQLMWLTWQAALAEPVQEPFCYVYEYDSPYGLHREFYLREYNGMKPSRTVPLYAAPPPRKPLTDEKVCDLWSWSMTTEAERTATTQQHAFARAIERAHGITP